jgi:hypothetical protein
MLLLLLLGTSLLLEFIVFRPQKCLKHLFKGSATARPWVLGLALSSRPLCLKDQLSPIWWLYLCF